MARLRRERFGFGIGIQGDFLNASALKSELTKGLGSAYAESGLSSYSDLAGTPWEGLYWGTWDDIDGSVARAVARSEMVSRTEAISPDSYLYGKPYSQCYASALDLGTFYKAMAHRGVRGGRVLVLGCGTGESLLDLELHGFEAYGIENNPESLAKANRYAASGIEWGDYLVDSQRYDKDSFDIVITDRISAVSRMDLHCFFNDIIYICSGYLYAPQTRWEHIRCDHVKGTLRGAVADTRMRYETEYLFKTRDR